MIELIIAFLLSVGWLDTGNEKVVVTEIDSTTFGIVVVDGVQQKTTVHYDKETQTFILQ